MVFFCQTNDLWIKITAYVNVLMGTLYIHWILIETTACRVWAHLKFILKKNQFTQYSMRASDKKKSSTRARGYISLSPLLFSFTARTTTQLIEFLKYLYEYKLSDQSWQTTIPTKACCSESYNTVNLNFKLMLIANLLKIKSTQVTNTTLVKLDSNPFA